MKKEDINLNISHLSYKDQYYQVLNYEGTDWDEEKTYAQYKEYVRVTLMDRIKNFGKKFGEKYAKKTKDKS